MQFRNTLFVGDAFATYAVTTGAAWPAGCALHRGCRSGRWASLARLDEVSADLVLPGAPSRSRRHPGGGPTGTPRCDDEQLSLEVDRATLVRGPELNSMEAPDRYRTLGNTGTVVSRLCLGPR